MVVLGVDPGLANLGYGVIDVTDHGAVAVDWGTVQTESSLSSTNRLRMIYNEIKDLIERHHPEQLILERLFFNRNVASAAKVFEARGVILLAASQADVPVIELTPQQIKLAVAGRGSAKKSEMFAAVRRILELPFLPTPDTADALAAALCAASYS